MKLNLFKGAAAFAAASFIAAAAHGQTTIGAYTGDVILSFYQTNSSGTGYGTDLEIDLGSFSNFLPGGADYQAGTVVNLSQLAVADISAQYGSDWNSDSSLLWAAAATNDGTTIDGVSSHYTLFGTEANNADAINGKSSTIQHNAATDINTIEQNLNDQTSTANSAETFVDTTSDTASFTGDGGSNTGNVFGFYGDGNFYNETVGTSTSDFYEDVTNTAGTDLGTFTLSSSGLSFEAPAAVPEPSTWATVALGALALVGFRGFRRRNA